MGSKSKKNQTLVGVFLFVGLFFIGAFILFFGDLGKWFEKTYEVKVSFPEAAGVIKGSTVRLRGAKIGEVSKRPLLVDGSRIEVTLAIKEGILIDRGSTFQIGSASILGDKEILISPPATFSGGYLGAGDEVVGLAGGGLDYLQEEAGVIAKETRELLREAQVSLKDLERSMAEVTGVVRKIGTAMDRVNGQVLSEDNLKNLGGTLANLEKASGSIVRMSEDLEPAIVQVGPVMKDLRGTMSDLQKVIVDVGGFTGTASSAMAKIEPALEGVPKVLGSLNETANSIQETAGKVSSAIEKVQSGKGALGALVSDGELKTDVKDFVRNLKEKGILRYKDEKTKEEDPRNRFRGRRR